MSMPSIAISLKQSKKENLQDVGLKKPLINCIGRVSEDFLTSAHTEFFSSSDSESLPWRYDEHS